MSRLFDDASTEYLTTASVPSLSALPVTISCWFRSDDTSPQQAIVGLQNSSSPNDGWSLRVVTDIARCFTFGTEGFSAASTTNNTSDNTWHNFVHINTSTTHRRSVLDGDWANSGVQTSTITVDPGAVDQYRIGASLVATIPISGNVAEVAVWAAALDQAEAEALAAGFSPLLIRPSALVSYVPLWRDEDNDHVTGTVFTPVNTPARPPVVVQLGRQSIRIRELSIQTDCLCPRSCRRVALKEATRAALREAC